MTCLDHLLHQAALLLTNTMNRAAIIVGTVEHTSNVLVTMEIQAHIAVAVIADTKVIRSLILRADVSIDVR